MFYDIGRSNWHGYQRELTKYFSWFRDGVGQLDADILVVSSPSIAAQLRLFLLEDLSKPVRANLQYLEVELNDLPLTSLRTRIQTILVGDAMKFYSLRDVQDPPAVDLCRLLFKRLGHRIKGTKVKSLHLNLPQAATPAPEYHSPDYLLLIWLKVYALKLARDFNWISETQKVTWMDFGLGHGDSQFADLCRSAELLDPQPQKQKIILIKRLDVALSSDPWYYARLRDDAIISATCIVCPANLIEGLWNWWQKEIKKSLNSGLIIDDQVLLGIFAHRFNDSVECVETAMFSNVTEEERWAPIRFFTQG
jgi:hypothetical protein